MYLRYFACDIEEHIKQLPVIFNRLQSANLMLSLAKCEFGQATVTDLDRLNQSELGAIPVPMSMYMCCVKLIFPEAIQVELVDLQCKQLWGKKDIYCVLCIACNIVVNH